MKITKPAKAFYLALLVMLALGCAEVIEKLLTDKEVALMAPVDNVVSADSLQSLYWEPLEDATGYQVQVVSPEFDSIVNLIADSNMENNIFKITLPEGKYQWRIRAFNNSSSTPFSDPRNITIQP